MSQCDTVKVETMCFKALQKRAKETKISESTGKFIRKKRFGKSLANKAPSMFLIILKNKMLARGGLYLEVDTQSLKASQYNHLNKEYSRKKLSQRWNHFVYKGDKIRIQRDLYSSFLIKNVNQDLKTIDNEACVNGFEMFLKLHDKEIDRLDRLKNLSSIGI